MSEPDNDHPLDRRFGAHGYECLALMQRSTGGDLFWLGYIWVPERHPFCYVSEIAGMPHVMAKVNYSDVKAGVRCTTLRLDVVHAEKQFLDDVECVIALTDCAAALRAMSDREVERTPHGRRRREGVPYVYAGARNTWVEPTEQNSVQEPSVE